MFTKQNHISQHPQHEHHGQNESFSLRQGEVKANPSRFDFQDCVWRESNKGLSDYRGCREERSESYLTHLEVHSNWPFDHEISCVF